MASTTRRADAVGEDWRDEALCAGQPAEQWFPRTDTEQATNAARGVCRRCPVRQLCLDYALAHDERHGIWGGYTERERKALGKQCRGGHIVSGDNVVTVVREGRTYLRCRQCAAVVVQQ